MLRGSLQRDSASRKYIMSKQFTADLSFVPSNLFHQNHFHLREAFGKNYYKSCFEINSRRKVRSICHLHQRFDPSCQYSEALCGSVSQFKMNHGYCLDDQ